MSAQSHYDWDAVRKANPGNGGVDVGEPRSSYAAIGVRDLSADIFDVTDEGGSGSHKFNPYGIIFMDVGKLGFLEITSVAGNQEWLVSLARRGCRNHTYRSMTITMRSRASLRAMRP
ncbi:MAG TPA: hypothetical protein VE242_00955 [Chthoniobacterales bacterium]|nr:hypothetical protein [Chthoniobacterales bacterium]